VKVAAAKLHPHCSSPFPSIAVQNCSLQFIIVPTTLHQTRPSALSSRTSLERKEGEDQQIYTQPVSEQHSTQFPLAISSRQQHTICTCPWIGRKEAPCWLALIPGSHNNRPSQLSRAAAPWCPAAASLKSELAPDSIFSPVPLRLLLLSLSARGLPIPSSAVNPAESSRPAAFFSLQQAKPLRTSNSCPVPRPRRPLQVLEKTPPDPSDRPTIHSVYFSHTTPSRLCPSTFFACPPPFRYLIAQQPPLRHGWHATDFEGTQET
jgi:hypothetical protein